MSLGAGQRTEEATTPFGQLQKAEELLRYKQSARKQPVKNPTDDAAHRIGTGAAGKPKIRLRAAIED